MSGHPRPADFARRVTEDPRYRAKCREGLRRATAGGKLLERVKRLNEFLASGLVLDDDEGAGPPAATCRHLPWDQVAPEQQHPDPSVPASSDSPEDSDIEEEGGNGAEMASLVQAAQQAVEEQQRRRRREAAALAIQCHWRRHSAQRVLSRLRDRKLAADRLVARILAAAYREVCGQQRELARATAARCMALWRRAMWRQRQAAARQEELLQRQLLQQLVVVCAAEGWQGPVGPVQEEQPCSARYPRACPTHEPAAALRQAPAEGVARAGAADADIDEQPAPEAFPVPAAAAGAAVDVAEEWSLPAMCASSCNSAADATTDSQLVAAMPTGGAGVGEMGVPQVAGLHASAAQSSAAAASPAKGALIGRVATPLPAAVSGRVAIGSQALPRTCSSSMGSRGGSPGHLVRQQTSGHPCWASSSASSASRQATPALPSFEHSGSIGGSSGFLPPASCGGGRGASPQRTASSRSGQGELYRRASSIQLLEAVQLGMDMQDGGSLASQAALEACERTQGRAQELQRQLSLGLLPTGSGAVTAKIARSASGFARQSSRAAAHWGGVDAIQE